MERYNHKKTESKWQKNWEKLQINKLELDKAKKPYYNLSMFPYPSAEGMHIGSMYTFTGIDTFGRYMRMKGFDVFEPMGLDAFGIHSENYALKIGEHVKTMSQRTEKHFYEQFHMLGNMYDWSRKLETSKPDYYKWTQWLFVQFFKAGLAYRKKSPVKFCPSCKTVLSDEQVINGRCERCGTEVTLKDLEQWFFEITKYADRLDANLKDLDWDKDVKLGQKNWIGKKRGINITYKVKDLKEEILCFTTRPDTNFGATFIVLAPEHDFVNKIVNGDLKADSKIKASLYKYLKEVESKSEIDRIAEGRKKTGVFTGFYAVNNVNGKLLPIWVSDFVLGNFGTGAVVGVPGHDKRDFEFAQEFGLEVIRVVSVNNDLSAIDSLEKVQEDEGLMVNSEFLNGLPIKEAIAKMMDHLEEHGWGKRVINFNLRDWCVSRQRYWGPPIPMIHCQICAQQGISWFNTSAEAAKFINKEQLAELAKEMPGWYPDENLPVLLPDIPDLEAIKPHGSGKGPLAAQVGFVKTTCPHCGKTAERETDVSDPFVDSAWYFLRYPFTEFDNIPFGGKFTSNNSLFTPKIGENELKRAVNRMAKWGPVHSYIGGREHTVLHLLYARFITMVFKDLGYLAFEEPFTRFYAHGLITKDGAKMSKSKGNVVNPDEYIDKYGADSVRMYLRFVGPFDQGGDWRDTGMEGMFRFISRLWRIYQEFVADKGKKQANKDLDLSLIDSTIKQVGEDLQNLKFNTAVAKIMQYVNWYQDHKIDLGNEQRREALKILALILAPFIPHLAEEFWQVIGGKGSVHLQTWPEFDAKRVVNKVVTIAIQVNGKLRGSVLLLAGSSQTSVEKSSLQVANVARYLSGKNAKKVIFVKDRIINFIV